MSEDKETAVTEQALGTPDNSDALESKSTEPKEGSKEYNFRRLEQEKKETEERLREEKRLNQELKSAIDNIANPKKQVEDEEINLSDDDLPEWKHVKKYAEKIAESKFNELSTKKEKATLPDRARQKFSDFDAIVSQENVSKLEKEHPDIALGLIHSQDPFSATYKILKQFYGQKEVNPEVKEEIEKMEENSNKIRSINTSGALKNASAFAKKSKAELYKEMMSFASRY